MLFSGLSSWVFLLTVTIVAAQSLSNSTTCAAVHIITVRASTERPGYGVMGNLAQAILDNVNGSTSEAIDYPALLEPYDTSSYAGVLATTKQLISHIDNCPKGKVILLGYSQVGPPRL
jgi:acetylxylan esterase